MNSASMVKGRGEKRLFSPSHPIHISLATVVRHLFSCISLNSSATRCKILPLGCPYTHFLQVCHTWSNCLCTIHLNVCNFETLLEWKSSSTLVMFTRKSREADVQIHKEKCCLDMTGVKQKSFRCMSIKRLFNLVREKTWRRCNIVDLGLSKNRGDQGLFFQQLNEIQVTHHLEIKPLEKKKFSSLWQRTNKASRRALHV